MRNTTTMVIIKKFSQERNFILSLLDSAIENNYNHKGTAEERAELRTEAKAKVVALRTKAENEIEAL